MRLHIRRFMGLEDLGFLPKGEAAAFIAGRNTAPGGSLPLNTDGGGLSYMHWGMYRTTRCRRVCGRCAARLRRRSMAKRFLCVTAWVGCSLHRIYYLQQPGAVMRSPIWLHGVKVIDCASGIAGPAAATMPSDFGADVIKVEPPGEGDPWRSSQPIPGKKVDYYWQLTSRNKRSLALDLKQPDGQAVLHRLVARADVFITNFPLPVCYCLRLSPAHLMPLNPRLIYGSFTAYGEEGEEAVKTGFD